MQLITEILHSSNGVAPRSLLLDRGVTSYALGRAVHAGRVVRVRRAWYAAPDADADVVRAVRVGGALSCRSALERLGVWVSRDSLLHVGVARNASRLRSVESRFTSRAQDPSGVRLHWHPAAAQVVRSVDSVATSLAHYSTCARPEFALVAMDCALNKRLVTLGELTREFTGFSASTERLLDRCDPRSQSGLETLARCRLRALGVKVTTQVAIPGVGRVDVLIGDRLVLELDGYGFHATGERFERDRQRDLLLHELGYRVVRLSYRQVMFGWPQAERIILTLVRRREHMWPRRGRGN